MTQAFGRKKINLFIFKQNFLSKSVSNLYSYIGKKKKNDAADEFRIVITKKYSYIQTVLFFFRQIILENYLLSIICVYFTFIYISK